MEPARKTNELHWTPELVRRYWDHISQAAGVYFTDVNGPGILATVHRNLSKDSRILDYGCGSGGLLGQLLEQGYVDEVYQELLGTTYSSFVKYD